MTHSARRIQAAAIGLSALVLAPRTSQAAAFYGVGRLPGGGIPYSEVRDVAAAGPTAVGYSITSKDTSGAFSWTPSGGIVAVGPFDPNAYLPGARGVSADGTVIVGEVPTDFFSSLRAFVWNPVRGVQIIGNFPGGAGDSAALDVSSDGRVVVGYGNALALEHPVAEAFLWTPRDGFRRLGDLPGGDAYSVAHAVSADGTVVAGGSSGSSGLRAFRWTAVDGMTSLGTLSGTEGISEAYGISADGLTIVGASTSTSREAFRWTAAGGVTGLGDLPGGGAGSAAHAVSGDGTRIVGTSLGPSGSEAFLWEAASGMRPLAEVLALDYGIDLTGWTLTSARAISADGLVIGGDGFNPAGEAEGWVAVLAP